MDRVATLPNDQRRSLFERTAAAAALAAANVEKDFWVCWILRRLFSLPDLNESLTFKGGTTLSKVHGVIQRFSEDVDVTIDRGFLGFHGDRDPAQHGSKKGKRLIEELRKACVACVNGPLKTKLEEAFAERLGESGRNWRLSSSPDDSDQLTLLFEYPSVAQASEYVKPVVRIELGARADAWPTEHRTITPYAADYFPDVFEDPECEVEVIKAERTFWEKATILHQEANRPEDKKTPVRYSRHYYDLAMMAGSNIGPSAVGQLDLLQAVVEHKKRFFRCGWAKYDQARPGTLRLIPSERRLAEIEKDYQLMAEMFFKPPPPFKSLIDELRKLEIKINSLEE